MIKKFNIKLKVKNEIIALTIIKKLSKISILKKQLIIFLRNLSQGLKKFHTRLKKVKLLLVSLNIIH